MGQSSSSTRFHRSQVNDVKDHLTYCLEEVSRWEDGASLVHEMLEQDISTHPERLSEVGAPPEKISEVLLKKHLTTTTVGGGQPISTVSTGPSTATGVTTGEESKLGLRPRSPTTTTTTTTGTRSGESERLTKESGAEPEISPYTSFDSEIYKHVLHSVDEVLRRSRGGENYFKNIPKDQLERTMTHPASHYVLPPYHERTQSSSRIFAIAALQALLEDQEHIEGGGVSRIASAISRGLKTAVGGETVGYPERLTEDVHGGVSREEISKQGTIGSAVSGLASAVTGGPFEKQTEIRGVSPSIGSETQPTPTAAATLQEEKKQGTVEQKPIGGVRRPGETVSSIDTDSMSLETLDKQRLVVAAKYMYILHFLHLLTQQAEFNYKAAVRLSTLKKQFKSQELPQLQRFRLEKLSRDNSERLERGIVGFDRAKLALDWLMHNYALVAASFKVNAAILQLKSADRRIRSHATRGGMAESIKASQLQEIAKFLSWFDQHHIQLLIEQQANERDALTVGLYFLDTSLSGYLEVHEVPDLSAKLFSVLDRQRKGRISVQDLQDCINSLCQTLDASYFRQQHLEGENMKLSGLKSEQAIYTQEKNTEEIVKLEHDLRERRVQLDEVYRYFHTQFIEHVFPRISPAKGVHDLSKVCNKEYLVHRLHQLELESKVNALEHEMNLGKYETRAVRQAVGTEPPKKGEERRTPTEKLLGVGRGTEQQRCEKGRERREVEEVKEVGERKPTLYFEGGRQETKPATIKEEEKTMATSFTALPTVETKGGTPYGSSTIEPVSETKSFGEKVKESIGLKKEEPRAMKPAPTETTPHVTPPPPKTTKTEVPTTVGDIPEKEVTTEIPSTMTKTEETKAPEIESVPETGAETIAGGKTAPELKTPEVETTPEVTAKSEPSTIERLAETVKSGLGL